MSELLTTPLHDWHVQHGGRMVDFAGWHMPVQFAGVVEEHTTVREHAGLFDVSHMGEIRMRGRDALANLQRLTVNDVAKLAIGRAHYTAMVNESGGMIDDLLVYRMGESDYLLVVNAGTTGKDFAWIESHVEGDLELRNESSQWGQLALQGPASLAVLSRLLPEIDLAAIRYYGFVTCTLRGAAAIVSRTGYTGEDGFEVYLASEEAPAFADAILEAGRDEGVAPIGLGARDTLRLEAGMLLYGNDMDETRSPVEAGVSWIVKPDKGDFIGREVLIAQLRDGTAERLVGLRMRERGIPRHGYLLVDASGARLGEVTSGTFSPTLKEGVGLGYVRADQAAEGTRLGVEIRGKQVGANIVKPPFYRRPK